MVEDWALRPNEIISLSSSENHRKRKRATLSCSACRKRKVKCDRSRPFCGACVKYGDYGSCEYDELSSFGSHETVHKKASTQPIAMMTVASSNSTNSASYEMTFSSSLNEFCKPVKFPNQVPSHGLRVTPPKSDPSPVTPVSVDSDYENTAVDFHSGVSSMHLVEPKIHMFNIGPLLGPSAAQRDFFVKVVFHGLFKYFRSMKDLLKPYCPIKKMKSLIRSSFMKRSLYDIPDQNSAFASRLSSFFHEKMKGYQINPGLGMLQALTNIDIDKHLSNDINQLLPPKPIIYMYIDRFFRYIYPAYPLIDESSFRADTEKLIGPNTVVGSSSDEDNQVKIDLTNASQVTHLEVGTLLLILKLAYITIYNYPQPKGKPLPEDVQLLKNYPIVTPLFELAKACINKYDYLRETGFELLLALYYTRVYYILGYEQADFPGSSESNILMSTILHSAIAIGIQVDPLNNTTNHFGSDTMPIKLIQLWRKAWHSLVIMDSEHSMNRGAPLVLNLDNSNTDYPSCEEIIKCSNCEDLNTEKVVIETLITRCSIEPVLRRLLANVYRLKSLPRIKDFEEDMVILEEYIQKHFRTYGEFVKDYKSRKLARLPRYDHSSSPKFALKIKEFLVLMEFLNDLKYQLYLSLEKQGKRTYSSRLSQYFMNTYRAALEGTLISQFWALYGNSYVANFESFQFLIIGNSSLRKFGAFFVGVLVRCLALKNTLLEYNSTTNGIRDSREKLLNKVVTLYRLYDGLTQHLMNISVTMDSAADSFYLSFKSQAAFHQCLRSITNDADDSTLGVNSLFKNYADDPKYSEMLLPNFLKDFDFDVYESALDLQDEYNGLLETLEYAAGENILGETVSGEITRKTSKRRFSNLHEDSEIMEYYMSTEPLTNESIESFWNLLRAKCKDELSLTLDKYLQKTKKINEIFDGFLKTADEDEIQYPVTQSNGEFTFKSDNVNSPTEAAPFLGDNGEINELDSLWNSSLFDTDPQVLDYYTINNTFDYLAMQSRK